MKVDWLFLVEVGTFEALPVISGESATEPVTCKNSWILWQSYAPPASCAAEAFQLSSLCRRNELGLTWNNDPRDEPTARVGSRYAQFGTRVPIGMGSEKLRDGIELGSWRDDV